MYAQMPTTKKLDGRFFLTKVFVFDVKISELLEKINIIESLQQKLEDKENELSSYGGGEKECTKLYVL